MIAYSNTLAAFSTDSKSDKPIRPPRPAQPWGSGGRPIHLPPVAGSGEWF